MRRIPLAFAASVLAFATPGAVHAHDAPQEEIRELTEELARAPHDTALLLERAEIWLQEHQPERAADDLQLARSLRAGLDHERAALLGAEVWMQRGRPAEAEAELDPAAEAGSLKALAARARVREAGERLEPALEDYDAVLERQLTVELALGRGRVLEALGRGEEAAAGYALHAARLGGAVTLRLARVAALRRLGRHDDALGEVDAIAALSRVDSRWLLLRGDILEDAGRATEARAARMEAVEQARRLLGRRGSVAVRLTYARALLAAGRRAEAETQLVRVQSGSAVLAPEATVLLQSMGADR